MEPTYIVGRSANADIRIAKEHDAVGKRHLELTDLGAGRVRIKDLQSTNGTFVRVAGRWSELKEARTLDATAEIMLGDLRTTPRALLDMATLTMPAPKTSPAPKTAAAAQEPPPLPAPPAKRPPRLRRNEFGEIVKE